MDWRQVPKQPKTNLGDVLPLSQPYGIDLDPSGKCNFHCRFCPCNNESYNKERRNTLLEFDLFLKICDDLAQFDESLRVITLQGFGEPLLNPNLCNMAAILRSRNLAERIVFTTNASLLTGKIECLADCGFSLIMLSLYASDRESYRQVTGVAVNTEELRNNIENLFIKTRKGNTKLAIKLMLKSEDDDNYKVKMFKEYTDITDYIFPYFENNAWPDFVVSDANTKSDKNIRCYLPFIRMMINSGGYMVLCCVDWKQDVIIGDLRKQSLKEIWEGEKLRNIWRDKLLGKLPVSCAACQNDTYRDDELNKSAHRILERLEKL